jgi:ABC-type molybdenum transport system ATPase subunit/photorepair protein PhrA
MISLSGVTKTYSGRAILTRLEFNFEPDRVMWSDGPSGSGNHSPDIAAGYEKFPAREASIDDGIGSLMQDGYCSAN